MPEPRAKVLSWQTATLFLGDVMRIGGVAPGVALCLHLAASGCRCNWVAGRPIRGQESVASRAGRWRAGDRLQCDPQTGNPWWKLAERCPGRWSRVDPVLAGPQDDHFTPKRWRPSGTSSRDPRHGSHGQPPRRRELTHNDQGRKLSRMAWRLARSGFRPMTSPSF